MRNPDSPHSWMTPSRFMRGMGELGERLDFWSLAAEILVEKS